MTLTLFGRTTSANVQKVLWALEEVGVAYEQVNVGGQYGGLDAPDFVMRNPNRLIPVIEDEGLVIWESHAILRYLAAQHGKGALWPEAARERALVDQWTEWVQTTFQPAWIGVFWGLIRTPPEERDPEAIEVARLRTEAALTLLGAQIEKAGDFICGDRFTYADIAAGASLYRWYGMDIPREPHPAIEGWYARLRDRPAFVKAVCVPF